MENKLPILVFDMNKPGNLVAAVRPEQERRPTGATRPAGGAPGRGA